MIQNELYSHFKFKVVMAKLSPTYYGGTPLLHNIYCLELGGTDSYLVSLHIVLLQKSPMTVIRDFITISRKELCPS